MATRGQEAIERLLPFVGKGQYVLGGGSPVPTTSSPLKWDSPVHPLGCDCSTALMWGLKVSRVHQDFPEYGGHINVDSALMDAGCIPGDHSRRAFFTEITAPEMVEEGDILMFPSVRAGELSYTAVPASTRIRIGHTGLITGWRNCPDSGHHWNGMFADLSVLECSSGLPAIKHGWDKNFHVQDNRATVIWRGKVHTRPSWRTRVVRYVGP